MSTRELKPFSPIFTYSGRGTLKRGVRAGEHGIIHSWGHSPQLLEGESGITKASISVVMAEGVESLPAASRIYYGIHHPIQYNVKVKEIGYVPPKEVPTLIGNWKDEDDGDSRQQSEVTQTAEDPNLDQIMEVDDEGEKEDSMDVDDTTRVKGEMQAWSSAEDSINTTYGRRNKENIQQPDVMEDSEPKFVEASTYAQFPKFTEETRLTREPGARPGMARPLPVSDMGALDASTSNHYAIRNLH